MTTKNQKQKKWGWIMLFFWAALIIGGIIAKRVYGHPDWIMFFHLPAAVMLVMSFNILSKNIRSQYYDQLKDISKRQRANSKDL